MGIAIDFVMAKKKREKAATDQILRSLEVPATQGMLMEVRDELKAEIRATEHRLNARFESIDSRFASMDARFEMVDARFEKLDSRIEGLTAEVHRLALLVEEQNARNRIVLDGLTGLFARQDRVENRLKEIEESGLSGK